MKNLFNENLDCTIQRIETFERVMVADLEGADIIRICVGDNRLEIRGARSSNPELKVASLKGFKAQIASVQEDAPAAAQIA